jgi:hypothetical protein
MNFATGMTRDLGSGGVCVVAEVLPLPGARIMLEIDLPRPADSLGQLRPDLLLRAEGIVLEHWSGDRQFGVTITYASLDCGSHGKGMEGHFDAPI